MVLSAPMVTKEAVQKALMKVIDPELGYNIVDLGLIYDISVQENGSVDIVMTLTSPGCPLADVIEKDIRQRVSEIEGIGNIHVTLTFSPPWSTARVSDNVKNEFRLMGIAIEE